MNLRLRHLVSLTAFIALLGAGTALAAGRDAAFMDPGIAAGGKGTTDAVTVEPKSEIDTGESVINIARRVTLFFVNQTNIPVNVTEIKTNGDGNVKSDIVSDDCTKQGKIDPSSRCSVTVEVTSASPGPWSVEVQMMHDGAGRIARAKLNGKTSGQTGEKKDNGLSLSTKDIKPVDFGEVQPGGGMAVRSALMLNDSPDSITMLSIDVIAAENGLERLDQGCMIDEELRPGESCPVTMVWKPQTSGQISTDLIIRHTGRTGFTVIPLRGNAKGEDAGKNAQAADSKSSGSKSASKSSDKIPPPSPDEIEKAASKLPPLPDDLLPAHATSSGDSASSSPDFHLIGTVGNRAVLLKPDGSTSIVDVGEDIPYGDGKIAKISTVLPREAKIFIDGKEKRLPLETSSLLTSKAKSNVTHTSEIPKPESAAAGAERR